MTAEDRKFSGAGVTITASAAGDPQNPPILLLHGGGQTRHSWSAATRALAAHGYYAVAADLRGHGESDWAENGDYSLETFRADVEMLVSQLKRRPILVGASLGGLASLLFVGENGNDRVRALVLVDIVTKTDPAGSAKIRAFMESRPEGFVSVEDAADAVSDYLPHRPRPQDLSGLARNLRLGADGRFHWHWDPLILHGKQSPDPRTSVERLEDAARGVRVPTLLIRGALSQIVTKEGAEDFLRLVPHAGLANIEQADHMVAGDQNDAFNDAILNFVRRLSHV
jgi:non-heme chloroperoxidase